MDEFEYNPFLRLSYVWLLFLRLYRCYCLSFVLLVQGGRSAEVHGQDGPCGGPESLAEGEGEIQEAQRETSTSRHVGVGVGAPETARPGRRASEELSLLHKRGEFVPTQN